MKLFFKSFYDVIAVVTILEYLFIAGMFTAPIAMALVWIVGIINVLLSMKEKNYQEVLLYLISMVALNMGYWKLL